MKRILIFLAIAFGASWGLILLSLLTGGVVGTTPYVLTLAACMFMPSVANALTRVITKEGFGNLMLRPRFRKHLRPYLAAWFAAPFFIFAGAALYFLIFPAQFDPTAPSLTLPGVGASLQSVPRIALLAATILPVLVIGPVVNIIPTLGEEFGWRGYLLPKLTELYGQRAAMLASGVIWGVWHAPMIAMGHNYGTGYFGAPWTGILTMIIFCTFLGATLSALTFRTGSAIPAAMTHSCINALAAAPLLTVRPGYNPLLGPSCVGLIGGGALIVVGLAILLAPKPILDLAAHAEADPSPEKEVVPNDPLS